MNAEEQVQKTPENPELGVNHEDLHQPEIQHSQRQTLRNPVWGENREDLHEKREYQRSAPKALLNSVLGESHEGLHCGQECHRSAPGKTLLNPVKGENLEDLLEHHDQAELECRRSARRCRTASAGSESTFTLKHQRKTRGQVSQPRARRNHVQYFHASCVRSLFTSENGAARPTSDFDAGRFESGKLVSLVPLCSLLSWSGPDAPHHGRYQPEGLLFNGLGFSGYDAPRAVFPSLLSCPCCLSAGPPAGLHHGRYGPEGGFRRAVQKTAENPQLQFIYKVVDIPFVPHRQIPMVQAFPKTIEIPQLRVDRAVDAPVMQVLQFRTFSNASCIWQSLHCVRCSPLEYRTVDLLGDLFRMFSVFNTPRFDSGYMLRQFTEAFGIISHVLDPRISAQCLVRLRIHADASDY